VGGDVVESVAHFPRMTRSALLKVLHRAQS